MIENKRELKEIVNYELNIVYDVYESHPLSVRKAICKLTKNNRYYRGQLIKSYRYFNYYQNKKKILSSLYWARKYGKYSIISSGQINCDNIGRGLRINHQGVNINKTAVIGENVTFVGFNCVGAGKLNEKTNRDTPIIGDNVLLGFGAKVIGGVTIANNVKVGAGAVVTKDVEDEGCTVIGFNKIIQKNQE